MAAMTALPTKMPRCLRGFEHVNRYWDKTHESWAAKILPGEFYVTREDEWVATVLGSCVSACVRDPFTGVGGMNHFMLPITTATKADTSVGLATRYGNFAMEHLINEVIKAGGQRHQLEVKIFGGGKVLQRMTMDVGKRNIEFVRHYLDMEGFRISAEDVGDVYPRKVLYRPKTGKVLMKQLMSSHNDTVSERETAYIQSITKQDVAGDVELF